MLLDNITRCSTLYLNKRLKKTNKPNEMYFVHREFFVLVAVSRKEINSVSTFRNMYLATAEQEHHSVELSEKIILVKSALSSHSPATKKVPGDSTKTKIFLRKFLGEKMASFEL